METISTEQALAIIAKGDRVHTFRNVGPTLIGADWDRERVEELVQQCRCGRSGEMATNLRHGLFVDQSGTGHPASSTPDGEDT